MHRYLVEANGWMTDAQFAALYAISQASPGPNNLFVALFGWQVAGAGGTFAAMDRLVVLDEGRVVEEGDHRSLLARGGLYARLWAHQSGGFLGDGTDDDEAGAALAEPSTA